MFELVFILILFYYDSFLLNINVSYDFLFSSFCSFYEDLEIFDEKFSPAPEGLLIKELPLL